MVISEFGIKNRMLYLVKNWNKYSQVTNRTQNYYNLLYVFFKQNRHFGPLTGSMANADGTCKRTETSGCLEKKKNILYIFRSENTRKPLVHHLLVQTHVNAITE